MNRDILKEYFERQESLDLKPRDEFKEELIRSLNNRIDLLVKRQMCYTILLAILVVALLIWLICRYLPMLHIALPAIDISPIFVLLTSLLFTIIFIASYLINLIELRELRRQLGVLE